MLNGLRREPKSGQQSFIFFTVHKSASTFIKNTIIKLIGPSHITAVELSGYLSRKRQEKYYNNPAFMKKVLYKTGYFFGAFRAFYPFPDLDKFKILLVLRDPRDVLTSFYFSTLYNHPLSTKTVYEERKKYETYTIDEYVLETAPAMQKKYAAYCKNLLNRSNVLFLKYEDMISDFSNWLHTLNSFLELKDNEEQLQEIIAATTFKVDKEDPKSFIRNIKSGDHLNKLKTETINKLNELFFNELKMLGYKI
ncbi:MAG: sulfotransferase domain-containing protein [Parafilimonas sp.]|nr:sulfotransferase domain-containing protein [Parafilimonas sp.]